MPSITVPGAEPRNQEEREIAAAMIAARTAFLALRQDFPQVPPSAISVGFINYGIQIGCEHNVSNEVVADYLRGCADRILAAPLAKD